MSFYDEQAQSKETRSKHDKQQQVKDIKSACRDDGSELMTPLAIAALFDISGAAIRMARMHGFIDAYVRLSVTGKPVELILLQTALDYWKRAAPADLEDQLTAYRENGTTLEIDSEFFNLLHSEKITTRVAASVSKRPGSRGRGKRRTAARDGASDTPERPLAAETPDGPTPQRWKPGDGSTPRRY